MSWRTVVISSRCKLDLKMGYMVIRGEKTTRIFLEEISMLILENSAISMTGCLLEALCERKVKIIFCDQKRNPYAELVPYYGSYDCSRKIKEQIKWDDNLKATVWTEIVTEKIRNQAKFLRKIHMSESADLLSEYLLQIQFNDSTNREGHAAKVYFNSVFGNNFSRSKDCYINSALNYGYSILLSAFNREVTANGYLTQLGIFHDNMFNNFNLSCDLMEPFRILIDMHVYENEYLQFEKDEKHKILAMFNERVIIDSTNQTIINAVKIYTKSVLHALENNDISKIKFISL